MNFKNLNEEITKILDKSDVDITNDNANSDGKSLCGVRNLLASALVKEHSMGMLNEEVRKKFKEGFIHIHDFDYYSLGATTCCQIGLGKILKGGFHIENCFMREPQSIHVAAEHCAIIFQTNQNQQYGGQSIPSLDFDLAPYVEKTFQKHRKDMKEFNISLSEQMEKAMELTIKETENAMEGLIHNLNSMHSRGGNQIVFSSLNFGLDTTWQGRLITKSVLKAQLKGLGDGATPIFPILIFKVKDGINAKKGEINYDLYELSLECLSKRLFPNFLFIDTKFNSEGFKLEDPNTHVATMGAVEGKEVITYKFKGLTFTESFERMWERTSKGRKIERQCESDFFRTEGEIEILDKNNDGENYFTKVKTVIKNDDQGNWWKLKLDNGRSLKLTEDHPLVTTNGRVKMEELKVGDEVFIDFFGNNYAKKDFKFDDTLWLLGMILCDGSYSGGRVSLSLGLDEYELVEKAKTVLKEVYGIETTLKQQERGKKGNYYDLNSVGSTSDFRKYLQDILGGLNKINRNVPTQFLHTREKTMSMLGGMIDADGHIKLVKGSPRLEIGSTNKELALQQMLLLQSCGYATKMYLNKYSKTSDKYRYKVECYLDKDMANYLCCDKKKEVLLNSEKTTVVKTPQVAKVVERTFLGNLNEFGYDVETESDKFLVSGIHSHNCRTRVFGNVNGDNFTEGRGNLSFTTLNLPMIAQEFLLSNTEGSFEEYLNNYIDLVIGQLHERYLLQKSQRKEAFSFLYDKCWTGSEDHEDDVVGDLLDNGSLSLGFIGLAEALKLLCGEHHAEGEYPRRRGEEIIKHLRHRMDLEADRTKLNYSLLATPAEGMAGSSLRKFVAKYGVIKDVSDKEFFTNSFHVPVYHNCSYVNKIRIESPYHDLCNAGHITYVEMDGNATKNLEGLNDVVQFAKESGIGYFSINLPIDRCRECGYDDWIDTDCPRCGSGDISRIRRITGYLVGDMERWNNGKRAEESMRVKHGNK